MMSSCVAKKHCQNIDKNKTKGTNKRTERMNGHDTNQRQYHCLVSTYFLSLSVCVCVCVCGLLLLLLLLLFLFVGLWVCGTAKTKKSEEMEIVCYSNKRWNDFFFFISMVLTTWYFTVNIQTQSSKIFRPACFLVVLVVPCSRKELAALLEIE